MERLGTIEDKFAVQEALDEYCLRIELNTFEEWLDLFADDAEMTLFRRTLKGRIEIAEMLSLAPHGVHLGGVSRISVTGDVAETVQNYIFVGDDESTSNNGWYFRTLVRTPEGWKISRMRVKLQKRLPRDSQAQGLTTD